MAPENSNKCALMLYSRYIPSDNTTLADLPLKRQLCMNHSICEPFFLQIKKKGYIFLSSTYFLLHFSFGSYLFKYIYMFFYRQFLVQESSSTFSKINQYCFSPSILSSNRHLSKYFYSSKNLLSIFNWVLFDRVMFFIFCFSSRLP